MKPCLVVSAGRLRPLAKDDLDDLTDLLQGPDVRRFLCDDVVLPEAAVMEMLERSERLDVRGLGLWAIKMSERGFAGVVGLEPVTEGIEASPEMAGGVEPIIALSPKFWGQGVAIEALKAVVRYARKQLGLSRLVAAVDEPNVQSHRLMQRCGFAAIGKASGPANILVLYELRFEESKPT